MVSIITDPRIVDRILRHLRSERSRARDPFESRAPPQAAALSDPQCTANPRAPIAILNSVGSKCIAPQKEMRALRGHRGIEIQPVIARIGTGSELPET
jgi:hypothetical protein